MTTPWTKIAPARRELLESLVQEFAHNYRYGRTMFGIDGPDASGKTTFGDELALAFERAGFTAVRASMDDFHRPREDRYRAGRHSGEGYYRDAYDFSLFRRVLADPFKAGGSTGYQLRGFDLARDVPFEADWSTGPADAVLIVDGHFLQGPELRGLWNYVLWLDAEREVRLARTVARDGADPDPEAPSNLRYLDAHRLYVRDVHPNTSANAIVDNTDPDAPKRRFADYCSIAPAPL
ncbi:uridine kinase [Pseudolysinimonas sp.]|uniref:uridine kinase n=1 Tax=Pseudolysinimonas sp. TaxID=2680009 RepID=UPI003784DB4D